MHETADFELCRIRNKTAQRKGGVENFLTYRAAAANAVVGEHYSIVC